MAVSALSPATAPVPCKAGDSQEISFKFMYRPLLPSPSSLTNLESPRLAGMGMICVFGGEGAYRGPNSTSVRFERPSKGKPQRLLSLKEGTQKGSWWAVGLSTVHCPLLSPMGKAAVCGWPTSTPALQWHLVGSQYMSVGSSTPGAVYLLQRQEMS